MIYTLVKVCIISYLPISVKSIPKPIEDATEEWFYPNSKGNTAISNIGSMENLKKLKDYLFDEEESNYDADIIPIEIENKPLEVQGKLQLLELVLFDTANEELDVLMGIELLWSDFRLGWDPKNFGNISKIDVPYENVWTPTVGMVNDVMGEPLFSSEGFTNKVELWSDGTVYWSQMSNKKVHCKLSMRYFPFDIQHCSFELDSVTDAGKIVLTLFEKYIYDYNTNLVIKTGQGKEINMWEVVAKRLTKNQHPVDKTCEICKRSRYTVVLKRANAIFITDIIVPCTFLTFLSGLSLWIPAGNDQRLSVNLSVLVAVCVYQVLAGTNLPVSSTLPILTVILLTQNILIFMSIVTTLAFWQTKNVLKNAKLAKTPIPYPLYSFFVKYIATILALRSDPQFARTQKKIDQLNELIKTRNPPNGVQNFTRNMSIIPEYQELTDKEIIYEKNALKTKLFVITLDRLLAIGYLVVLGILLIVCFTIAPSESKRIEDIWEEEDKY